MTEIIENNSILPEPIETPIDTALEPLESAPNKPKRIRRAARAGGRLVLLGACLYGAPALTASLSGEIPHPTETFGAVTITMNSRAGVNAQTRLSTVVGDQQLDTHYGYGIEAYVSKVDIKKIENAARSQEPVQELTNAITHDREEITFDHFGIKLNREDLFKLRFASELMFAIGGSTAVAAFAGGEFARRKLAYERKAPVLKALGMGTLAIAMTVGGFSLRDTEKVERTGAFAYVTERKDIAKKLDTFDSKYGHTAASSLALIDSILAHENLPYGQPSLCLLLVSDRHQRDILPMLKEYIRLNDCIGAVVDGGDQVDWGQSFENTGISDPGSVDFRSMNLKISDLGVPYFVVKGNHDSFATMDAMKAAGATELNGQPETVSGLKIMGQGRIEIGNNGDLFTPDKAGSSTEGAVLAKAFEAAQIELGRELDQHARSKSPDLLAVHYPNAANDLYGLAPLVMTGHAHRQFVETKDGAKDDPFDSSTHLQVGTTGAGGLRNEDNGKPTPQEFMIIKFDEKCQFIGGTSFSFDSLGSGDRKAEDFWNKSYDSSLASERKCRSTRLG